MFRRHSCCDMPDLWTTVSTDIGCNRGKLQAGVSSDLIEHKNIGFKPVMSVPDVSVILFNSTQ